MITIDPTTYSKALRVLRNLEKAHPDARDAANRLLLAGLESEIRDLEFNEAPALCRPQAG